jgi:hypothetical protein
MTAPGLLGIAAAINEFDGATPRLLLFPPN